MEAWDSPGAAREAAQPRAPASPMKGAPPAQNALNCRSFSVSVPAPGWDAIIRDDVRRDAIIRDAIIP